MENTQDRLLAIAARLFAAEGFAGTSMRSIGREAGITQAAIYHHFPNKEALYLAAIERLFEGKRLVIQETIEERLPPEEKLQRLVRDMLRLVREDDDFRKIYYRELIEADEFRLGELAGNVFTELHELLQGVMRQLAPDRDPVLLLMSLSGLVFEHVEATKLTRFLPNARPEHVDPAVIADHICSLFLYGALPR
jgi:AcrR family transcriptional regulator